MQIYVRKTLFYLLKLNKIFIVFLVFTYFLIFYKTVRFYKNLCFYGKPKMINSAFKFAYETKNSKYRQMNICYNTKTVQSGP